jgi:ribonuclease J
MDLVDQRLRILPLGGLGEIGMNVTAIECDDSIIVIDCGMMFPDQLTLGVDVIIPDLSYLVARSAQIAGIFLTHGHEDHIGAIPYLLKATTAPVFGTRLTLGFVREKLAEFEIDAEGRLHELRSRDTIAAGAFQVEAIHVTHSIPDSLAFAIRTPLGIVVHTGDFKIDQTPVDGRTTDVARFAEYGDAGVLLLLSDSTGAATDGHTPSEAAAGAGLDRVFSQADGRIIITTISSHIHRIQQLVTLCERHRRRLHAVGRSVKGNIEIAERLGHLKIPSAVRPFGSPDEGVPRATAVLVTGSQGEPRSALSRLARGELQGFEIRSGDTVVISARSIPGNEVAIRHMADLLCARGAWVVRHEAPHTHVSGHASADDLLLMLNLVRPKYFLPIHGTIQHLMHHARLARHVVAPERIFVAENGDALEIATGGAHLERRCIPVGKLFVDQASDNLHHAVVHDRQKLATDGFVSVVAAIDAVTGCSIRAPEIITRGVVHVAAEPELLADLQRVVSVYLAEQAITPQRVDVAGLELGLKNEIRDFFGRYMRSPIVLPVVWSMSRRNPQA